MATVTVSGGAPTSPMAAAVRAAFALQEAQGALTYGTAIDLTAPTTKFMAVHAVTGATAFSLAASPVAGACVYLRLTANGVNIPDFSAFKEWGGSMGYDNRNGIVNVVQFFHDGVDAWFSVTQQLGATVPASSILMSGPTSGTVSVASTNFSISADGTLLAPVTVTPSDGGAGGTFTPSTVTISSGTPTATFTYTAPATPANRTISVTNNGGLGNPANITYNASAASSAFRLTSTVSLTESGSGPYSYVENAGATLAIGTPCPGGVGVQAFQAGVDGYFQGVIQGFASQSEPIIGVTAGSGNVGYGGITYGIYGNPGSYQQVTSGGIGPANNTGVAPTDGDVIRVERIGSTLTVKVAPAATPTVFTTVHTWTGVSTGVLHPQCLIAKNLHFNSLSSSGLA